MYVCISEKILNEELRKMVENSGVTTVNVLLYNLPFYCLSRIAHMKCCPSFASAQLLDSSMILVKEEKTKT